MASTTETILAVPPKRSVTVEEAFRYCGNLARSHYENFTVGSWLLPSRLRQHVFNIYAYCRTVDDLGDKALGDRMGLLDDWEQDLRHCYTGAPRHPALIALQPTIEKFRIPIQPFQRLIKANRMDQCNKRYPTFQDLLYYCNHSANPVGHLVLYLFGYRDEERQHLADATCTALQLANFWQDVARDLEMGRIYLPLEDMARFHYSEEDLENRRFNDHFRRLMAFQIQRTRDLFHQGLKLVPLMDTILKVDLELFSRGGLKVLDSIEKLDYNVFKRRPTIAKAYKARLLVPTLIKYRWSSLIHRYNGR